MNSLSQLKQDKYLYLTTNYFVIFNYGAPLRSPYTNKTNVSWTHFHHKGRRQKKNLIQDLGKSNYTVWQSSSCICAICIITCSYTTTANCKLHYKTDECRRWNTKTAANNCTHCTLHKTLFVHGILHTVYCMLYCTVFFRHIVSGFLTICNSGARCTVLHCTAN